jgi:hypothetical protein
MNILLVILFAILIVASIVLSIIALLMSKHDKTCKCPMTASPIKFQPNGDIVLPNGQNLTDVITKLLPPPPEVKKDIYFYKVGNNGGATCDEWCADPNNKDPSGKTGQKGWCVGGFDVSNKNSPIGCSSTITPTAQGVNCLCQDNINP